jgi:hypothetical protein
VTTCDLMQPMCHNAVTESHTIQQASACDHALT